MRKMYIVKICSGYYEGYTETDVFVTEKIDIAARWCDKYNKIISDNRDRIESFYNDGDFSKKPPMWHELIAYENPIAKVSSVKFRLA